MQKFLYQNIECFTGEKACDREIKEFEYILKNDVNSK